MLVRLVQRIIFNFYMQAIKSEELINLLPSSPVLLISYGPWQGRGPVVRGVEHIQR